MWAAFAPPPEIMIESTRSAPDVAWKKSSVFCSSAAASSATPVRTGWIDWAVWPATGSPRLSDSACSKFRE